MPQDTAFSQELKRCHLLIPESNSVKFVSLMKMKPL